MPWDEDGDGDADADDLDADDGAVGDGRAPICPACGVTALPQETTGLLEPTFVCEHPDCEAFGEEVS